MSLYWLLAVIPGQIILWALSARIAYRTVRWHRFTPRDDRLFYACFWGFFWPVLLAGMIARTPLSLVGMAMTAPSLSERREKRRAALRQRLSELDRQVREAEARLREATEDLEQNQE